MMKTKIWIFTLFCVSSIITVTSNGSTNNLLASGQLNETDVHRNSTMLNSFIKSSAETMSTVTTPHINNKHSSALSNYVSKKSIDLAKYSYSYNTNNKNRRNHVKIKRAAIAESSKAEECQQFVEGNKDKKTLYSPRYPSFYPNNTDCIHVIEAPEGHIIRVDFREYFHIEKSEECKFDYLEIRDGGHGFSNLKGRFCGDEFPDYIQSKSRWLWLRFHSDENIEYKGFVIVYEFLPRPTNTYYDDDLCVFDIGGSDGIIDSSNVTQEVRNKSRDHSIAIDCMWIIEVAEGSKILLSFLKFQLEKPNDCDNNFVDVFPEETDYLSRLKGFCGSIADSVVSKTNILHVRYYAEPAAINSTFSILYTAFREKPAGESCYDDEFDCEDATCIAASLKCDGVNNCRFSGDEGEECKTAKNGQSEHVVIIIVVFGLILGTMMIAFFVNCMKKIIRDHKIIREHIRQSRESKLDELGRHSTKLTKSRENIALATLTKIPPPSFENDSPTSINLIENNSNHNYYRETVPMPMPMQMQMQMVMPSNGATLDNKNDYNLREQEIILGTSYVIDDDRNKDAEMCDSACQTRESLFQPVFQKSKVTQSPCPVSQIRFSTFGYEASPSTPPPPLQIPPPPNPPNVQTSTMTLGWCPAHPSHANQGTMTKQTSTLPHGHHQHQHQHHHHYHHVHTPKANSDPNSEAGGGDDPKQKIAKTSLEMEDYSTMDADGKKVILKKDDTQRSFSEIRKSAPDVIIMTSTSSH